MVLEVPIKEKEEVTKSVSVIKATKNVIEVAIEENIQEEITQNQNPIEDITKDQHKGNQEQDLNLNNKTIQGIQRILQEDRDKAQKIRLTNLMHRLKIKNR